MCVCVCVCVSVFGVNCSIKLGQESRIFLLIFDHYFFFHKKSIWNTETKSSQIFNYTQVTNEDVKPTGSHYMANKLRKSLTFQQKNTRRCCTLRNMEVFRKVSYLLQIFAKKSLGPVLFSRDGRVIRNILLFSALLKFAKGELYFPLKNIYDIQLF